MVLKAKEMYPKLKQEKFEKINSLDKNADTNELVFKYKGNTADANFNKFDNALSLINKIRDDEISLNGANND